MAFILAGQQDEVVEPVIGEMRERLEQTIPLFSAIPR
jgi:hypothetical protein